MREETIEVGALLLSIGPPRWKRRPNDRIELLVFEPSRNRLANGVPKVPGIGIFIAGPGQAQIPFFNGDLCVNPNGLQRINQVTPVANNTVIQAIDLTGANTGTAPLNVVVGQPYNFQYWFRDPVAGGANANFSDGLSVPILP